MAAMARATSRPRIKVARYTAVHMLVLWHVFVSPEILSEGCPERSPRGLECGAGLYMHAAAQSTPRDHRFMRDRSAACRELRMRVCNRAGGTSDASSLMQLQLVRLFHVGGAGGSGLGTYLAAGL